ncbi:MAG: pyruvate formate-lyase-activating protein [Candidatus Absconditabacteria bacterium]|nr:pyruvate formate-lyase-activating protein [Candidatus Absconditabacteria bacterium]
MLRIHSIESFGTHEGPGIRFVLFLQGCFFKCLYCHNPDTISLEGGKMMSVEDIVKQVIQVKPYFRGKGGFTVSGGEPLIQAKELFPLFKKLKKEGIHIAVDTNGFWRNDDVKNLIPLVDLFLVDIKHINNDWHQKLTGKSNENILKFVDYLESIGKAMRIRYVLVTGWTDQEEYIKELGEKFGFYKNIERIEILPYHQLGVYKWKELGRKYGLEGIPSTKIEQAEEVKKQLEAYFKKVVIRA